MQAKPHLPEILQAPVLPVVAGRQVLLVDDNADAADMLEALLDMDGFTVSTVYDGATAVQAFKSLLPDIVVMDIGMPGMSGYEAARLMREHPGGDRMILIALTGWDQAADRERASEAGFNHHLVKPVDYETLIKCLNK